MPVRSFTMKQASVFSTVHGAGKRRGSIVRLALLARGRALAPVVDLCSLDALAARPLSKEYTQAPTLMPMNCKGSLQGACFVQMAFGLVKLHPRLQLVFDIQPPCRLASSY